MNKYISKTRFIYFLFALVVIIGCYVLNLSYSMFVQTEESNLVDVTIPPLNVSLSQTNFSVDANITKIYSLIIDNQSSVPANFALNASTDANNFLIQVVDIPDNLSYGTIEANSKKNVVLAITNNNETEISFDFEVENDYTTRSYDFDAYLSNTIIDNINKYNNNFKSNIIIKDLVTNGDGLYNVDGNFIYKGSLVNNFFKFSSDTKLYRIVSLNNDNTIKLVDAGLNKNIAFDASSNRTYNIDGSLVNSSYCTNADLTPTGEIESVKYGCNAFKAYDTLTTSYSSGTVVGDSTIKKYLDTEYFNSLSDPLKNILITHTFYNGYIDITDTASTSKEKNKNLSFESNVGLLNIEDVINSDLTITDNTIIKNFVMTNYLIQMNGYEYKFWLLNGSSANSWDMWVIANGKTLNPARASRETQPDVSTTIKFYARPVIYISDDIVTSGIGSSEEPYIVDLN